MTVSGADSSVVNVNCDGAGLTSSRGFVTNFTYLCAGLNCTNGAFVSTNIAVQCRATGCSAVVAFSTGIFVGCVAYDNTITGFALSGIRNVAVRCIADSNTGATSDGFDVSGAGTVVLNCVAYNNGRDGVRISDDAVLIQNTIAESNVGTGINNVNQDSVVLVNNATFGNGTGITPGTGKGVLNIGAVAGSASFFTNAAGQDFSLNNTGGAGAAARAAGFPGVLPVGGTGFLDIGALQHADPAGSGGLSTHPGMSGRCNA
jgi:hypothetical protein